jgi:transposase
VTCWASPAFTDSFDRLKSLGGADGGEWHEAAVFPDAFKLEAAAALRGGRSVIQIAAELGLPDRLVRAWLRWADGRGLAAGGGAPAPRPAREPAAPARRVGPSPAEQAAEIARLRRELDRVRLERDILKRAVLIFGQATSRR